MEGKVVRDPIHGNIRLDSLALDLIDCPQMQRLRNIKQNGLCYLVYPAMNSTRFEHSLGVYHLGGMLCEHLGLSEGDSSQLKAACLLHDVGHGPFSHTFDAVWARYGFDHETRSQKIVLHPPLSDKLKAHGVRPASVAKLILGEGKLGKILSSEIDVDKMDYLVRDAYYAGVAYGVTDIERLLVTITLERGDLVIDWGGIEAAESLLINRNMMYQTVYRHHTKRIAESMMVHAMMRMIDGAASMDEISSMDDISLISRMRSSSGYVREMMERIDERRLFKSVFSERIALLSDDFQRELSSSSAQLESRMAKDAGIKEGYLFVDYPQASMSEYRVKVRSREGLKSISEVSHLAKSLQDSEADKLTVNVCVRPEDRRKIGTFNPQRYFRYQQTKLSGYM
jgi:uncharacterized protein